MAAVEMKNIVEQASEIARAAGALLREYFERGVVTEYNGDVDLVTAADRASEKYIGERLTAAFPDHGIFGEEGTRSGLDKEYRWYVDPLDGTTNFAHSFPQFCVSMGLEHRAPNLAADEDGYIVAAIIYDPKLFRFLEQNADLILGNGAAETLKE